MDTAVETFKLMRVESCLKYLNDSQKGCLLRYLYQAPFLSNRLLESCAEAQSIVREGVSQLSNIAAVPAYLNGFRIKTHVFVVVVRHVYGINASEAVNYDYFTKIGFAATYVTHWFNALVASQLPMQDWKVRRKALYMYRVTRRLQKVIKPNIISSNKSLASGNGATKVIKM